MAWQDEVWQVLGIEPTGDERSIKRAYAKRLKQTRPEDDPAGFQQLRQAYEHVLFIAQYIREQEQERENDTDDLPSTTAQEQTTQATAELSASGDTSAAMPLPMPMPVPQEFASDESSSSPERLHLSVTRLHISLRPQPELEAVANEVATNEVAANEIAAENPNAPELHDAERESAHSLHISPRPQSEAEECLPREEIELTGTPFEIANQLWQEFVGQHDVLQASSLKRLLASKALLNLDVREAFEFYCAQYCADEHADVQMRRTIVEFFGWQQSFSHLLKIHPMIPHVAMERYAADQGHQFLALQSMRDNPQLKYLLADHKPRFMWAMFDRKFINNMRENLHLLQWRYPEVIRYKLNEQVVDAWRELVNKKRYFRQTLTTSLIFGVLAFIPLLLALNALDWIDQDWRILSSFVLAQTLTVGGFAWFSFHPPQKLLAAVNFLRDTLLYRPMHVYRYEQRFQIGYLPIFFCLPFEMMLGSQGEFAQNCLLGTSVLVCLLAMYAASLYFSWFQFAIAIPLALVFQPLLATMAVKPVDPISVALLCYTFAILLLRTGPGLLAQLKISRNFLQSARLVWLTLAILMFALLPITSMGESQAAPFLFWLLLFAPGFMLASFLVLEETIYVYIFNFILLKVTTTVLWPEIFEKLDFAPRLNIILAAICVLGICILTNLTLSHIRKRELHFPNQTTE